MTMTIADADELARSFTSTADLIAKAIKFTDKKAMLGTCDSLDQLYTALSSAARSSGGVTPYALALIVTELQEAIARRLHSES
jgi:hypothetical protein